MAKTTEAEATAAMLAQVQALARLGIRAESFIPDGCKHPRGHKKISGARRCMDEIARRVVS